jgi:hypothetical protein
MFGHVVFVVVVFAAVVVDFVVVADALASNGLSASLTVAVDAALGLTDVAG